MKNLTLDRIQIKFSFIIFITALLLIEVSRSEGYVVVAQGDVSDEELAKTLVMETANAMDWRFGGKLEDLDYFDFTGNAIFGVYAGAYYVNAIAIVFPTDSDAEAFINLLLSHQVEISDGSSWWSFQPWYLVDAFPTRFHEISAVGALTNNGETNFLGWHMSNFFLACYETKTDGPQNGTYYRLGCEEELYNIALRHGLGSELHSDEVPPQPAPDTQDIGVVIDQINKTVSNPAVPITGAVAGTLLAALLAALRGGLPPPVRNLPPIKQPAPKPGQVNAKGQVYSPVSKSWVSPQMYDYQKNWSEKGWRWNPRTGRFEGQHGAVNENGQVMDEELGWVDQKSFQQNEQMRSEGMVYDRNLGWQTPEDLNRFENEREGIRQRGREFSAEKNAQIQREIKEAQAQRDQAFREKMRQIDARRAEGIKADMEMYQKRAQRYIDRDKQLENYAYIAEKIEAAADMAIAVCARLTGPAGKSVAAAYESIKEVAVIADDVIAADDRIGRAQELQQEKIEEKQKEKNREEVEEKISSYVPKSVNRFWKKITKPIKKTVLRRLGKTGLIIYKEVEKKVVDMAKEGAEELVEEQIETVTEAVKDAIDPYLLTGT